MATHSDFAHDPDDTSGLAAWTDEHGNFFCHPDFEEDLDRLRRAESVALTPRPTGRHASLFVLDDAVDYDLTTADPRALQAAWGVEDAEARRARRLQRVAIGRATGLTPDQFRRGGSVLDRVLVSAGVLLLMYMALRIIAVLFAGRL